MLNRFARSISVLLICTLVIPGVVAQEPSKAETIAVKATDWGKVWGQVYDAETELPVEGAQVVVQQDGGFASEGRTLATTSPQGQYKCSALLGRVSSNIDVGRLLNVGLLGLALGGAKKVTKRIDVTRLNLRVTADGYCTFEGVVPCRTADAESFRVNMEPILLTREDSPEVPTVAEGWGAVQMTEVIIDPPILKPGDEADVTVRLKCPPVTRSKEMKVSGYSFESFLRPSSIRMVYVFPVGWKLSHPGLVKQLGLKAADAEDDQPMVYLGKIKVPESSPCRDEVFTASVVNCPYDVSEGAGSDSGLLQVVTSDDETEVAEVRLEAYQSAAAGDTAAAREGMKGICALDCATAADFQRLAGYSEATHDYPAAAEALREVVERVPEKETLTAAGDYARALLLADEPQRVLDEVAPRMEGVGKKKQPKVVPLDMVAAIGLAYLRTGDLEQAEAANTDMARWAKTSTPTETSALFRRELRLARAEAALEGKPDEAQALADYGRLMVDMGRWDEAVSHLRKAVETDPEIPGVQWDLHYALLQVVGEQDPAETNFEEALAAAEQQVQPLMAEGAKKKRQTKDFFAWHQLGILLYRKACMQQQLEDPAAADTLTRCRDALVEALKCGRAGAEVEEGQYWGSLGYMSPKVVAISGFAYPEANYDYLILDTLTALETQPDDYLAHFNLATALIDLGQYDLAAARLQRCLDLEPDFTEAGYGAALIALHMGDRQMAAENLRKVLDANPRHPRANLTLAEIRTDEGDMAGAAACLAAHAKLYGRRD